MNAAVMWAGLQSWFVVPPTVTISPLPAHAHLLPTPVLSSVKNGLFSSLRSQQHGNVSLRASVLGTVKN